MEIRKPGKLLPVTVLLALCALGTMLAARGAKEAAPPAAPGTRLPREIGPWVRTRNVHFGERVLRKLGTPEVYGAVYRDPRSGDSVYLVVVFATNNRSAFHPPEYCMEGSGFSLHEKRRVPCVGQDLAANEMVFTRGAEELLVWNWYAAGKALTADFYRQQFSLLLAQMRTGRARGAAVTVYTHVAPGKLERGKRANEDFARSLVPYLGTRL